MLRDAPAQKVDSGRPALLQAVIDAMRIPDLRYRILFTLGILIIFRFLAHVPVPGVDRAALSAAFDANPILGFLDLFSGGALRNLSIAALGVYPYITASIIIQVLTPIIPSLKALLARRGLRAAEDQSVHALPDGAVGVHAGIRSAEPAVEHVHHFPRRRDFRHRVRRQHPEHHHHSYRHDGWNNAPRVDGRIDHRKGDRQRYFTDYLRGDRDGISGDIRPAVAFARSTLPGINSGVDWPGDHLSDRVFQRGSKEDSRPVRAECVRAAVVCTGKRDRRLYLCASIPRA